MKNSFYVYGLVDPRDNVIFYVGKGRGERFTAHVHEAARPEHLWVNRQKCLRIINIQQSGSEVQYVFFITNVDEATAFAEERNQIRSLQRLCEGGALTNISSGGAGGTGNPEPVSCYSKSGKYQETFDSLTIAAEQVGLNKSTICAALNGRIVFAGGMRWTYKDRELSMTTSLRYTSVSQYTIDGQFMQTYDSVNQAAHEVGVAYTSLIDCCRGVHATAGGFRWTYKDQPLIPLSRATTFYQRKRYQAYDPANQTTMVFNSIKEAASTTSANATGISDCCAGRKKTSGGLQWSYVYQ